MSYWSISPHAVFALVSSLVVDFSCCLSLCCFSLLLLFLSLVFLNTVVPLSLFLHYPLCTSFNCFVVFTVYRLHFNLLVKCSCIALCSITLVSSVVLCPTVTSSVFRVMHYASTFCLLLLYSRSLLLFLCILWYHIPDHLIFSSFLFPVLC